MNLSTPELSVREVKYFSAMAELVMKHGSEGLRLTSRDVSALAEAMRERVFEENREAHELGTIDDVQVTAVQTGEELTLMFYHSEAGHRCIIGTQLLPAVLNA